MGSWLIGAALVAVAGLCLVRLFALWKRLGTDAVRRSLSPFCIYIAVIGIQAVFAYTLSDAVNPDGAPILRYAFLGVFVPIALVTALFEVDRTTSFRAIAAGLLCACAAVSVVNNVRCD